MIEKHIPEHRKDAKPELDEEEDFKNVKIRKTLIKVIAVFHPDKSAT